MIPANRWCECQFELLGSSHKNDPEKGDQKKLKPPLPFSWKWIHQTTARSKKELRISLRKKIGQSSLLRYVRRAKKWDVWVTTSGLVQWYCSWKKSGEPVEVDSLTILLTEFYTSQVVQDFFHQQWVIGKPPSSLFLYWDFITSAVLAFFLLVAAVTSHCTRNMDEGFLISTRAESLFKLIYYIKIHTYYIYIYRYAQAFIYIYMYIYV